MPKIHQTHFYHDGDVLIDVEDTRFKVHSNIIRLASGYFAALLKKKEKEEVIFVPEDVPEDENNREIIAHVEFKDRPADQFQDLLSIIYPHTDVAITWENAEYIGDLSQELDVPVIISKLKEFLALRIAQQPLHAFFLADRFKLAAEYQEASQWVIDELLTIQMEPLFDRLSDSTKLKLYRTYTLFVGEVRKTMVPSAITDHIEPNGFSFDPCGEAQQTYETFLIQSCPSKIWGLLNQISCDTCKSSFLDLFETLSGVKVPETSTGKEHFLSINLD